MTAAAPAVAGRAALLGWFVRVYALSFSGWFLAGFACLAATNWLSVHIPLELAVGIDGLRQHGLRGEGRSALLGAAGRIAVMGSAIILVRTASRVFTFTPGRLVEYRLKGDLFRHLLRLSPGFYGRTAVGDIVSRASSDITYVRVLVGFGVLAAVNTVLALGMAGYQMVVLSPRLTLLVTVPVLVAVAVVQLGIRRLFQLSRQQQEQVARLSEHILSSLQGVQTIQAFNAEGSFAARFAQLNAQWLDTGVKLTVLRSAVLPLLGLAGGVSVFVLLWQGGVATMAGSLTVGELVAFSALVAFLLGPLRSLGWLISVVQTGLTSLERVHALLAEEPERPEGSVGLTPPAGAPGFRVRGLSFRYPGADREALSDVSADVPPGAFVGVFGRTGSGKTTLLRLLLRLWNPAPGTVQVLGGPAPLDVTQLGLAAWRRKAGVVPQLPFLFSESLRENVELGESDEERLKASLAAAALADDLEVLPQGVDTEVGERGVMLSGGQRQRVALARALFRDADLLVLDDVLSAVDHDTERRLIARLRDPSRSRPQTLLMASHRMSALVQADLVLVLDEGRLVDRGTHAELITRPGPYRDAWFAGDAAEAAEASA